jgi:CRISPR-associated protein Csy2
MTTEDQAAVTGEAPSARALLVVPRLRVQNANTVSSPLTWGFPAITAFTGLMTALERRLGREAGLALHGVGVICHHFEPQVTRGGFVRSFHLTRNPVLQDGSTAAIVEEGRAHLDITLVFDAELTRGQTGEAERAALAAQVTELLAGMRVAGGSVMPPLPPAGRAPARPQLRLVPDDDEARLEQFNRLKRRWLPGFALVSRDDLLQQRLTELRQRQPQAGVLEAWLSLVCLTHRPERQPEADVEAHEPASSDRKVPWQIERRPGWIVPLPVGYAALSDLHPAGGVAGARDARVPLRFVESVYSLGQWISPHRLTHAGQLFWYPAHAPGSSLYRCFNDFIDPPVAEAA